VKLDIGCGESVRPGFIGIDRKLGGEAFPLKFNDGNEVANDSADEIVASHVLEHFSHQHVGLVLMEWARVLKPGGIMRLAVPDFEKLVHAYRTKSPGPLVQYLMGGQADDNDYHRCIFDRDMLSSLMSEAGLIDIREWQADAQDCAAKPVSLNLQGMKPREFKGRVKCVMSVPRLGFMDNFTCWSEALIPLGITPLTVQGAFWGQCLERAMEQVEDDADWILTVDYDSFFTLDNVRLLLLEAANHPEADAIAPIQMKRGSSPVPLLTRRNADGSMMMSGPVADFREPMMPVYTSHFGCTLIRVEALKRLPHPWFKGKPNSEGRWGDGRTDDDIWFWKRWAEVGNTVYSANQVIIGHGEYTILWPDRQMRPMHQMPHDWREHKCRPATAWR